jgi:hypothetical protein
MLRMLLAFLQIRVIVSKSWYLGGPWMVFCYCVVIVWPVSLSVFHLTVTRHGGLKKLSC